MTGFLEALDTPAVRRALEERQDSQEFGDLSDKARLFRNRFHCLFQGHLDGDNATIRGHAGETRPWTGPADTPTCRRCP